MFCTHCGASNNDDAKFCANCGESLSEVSGKEKPSRSRRLKEISFTKVVDFFRILFDFSFSQFITSKIIKLLYGLSILCAGLIAFFVIIFGFDGSTAFGIFTLLMGILFFLLMVICTRVLLETIIVIFRLTDRADSRAGKPESRDNIQWNL